MSHIANLANAANQVSSGVRELLGEAFRAERDYLESRYEIAQRALACLLDAGGVTHDEREFTLAMHGFTRGDAVSRAVGGLLANYDVLDKKFGKVDRRPVASLVRKSDHAKSKQLEMIALIAPQPSYPQRETPFTYRVEKLGDDWYQGKVELPVLAYHEWTPNPHGVGDDTLEVQDGHSLVVASVQRSVNPYSFDIEADKAVDAALHLKVGWTAILASHKFDEAPYSDRLFMERVAVARAAFDSRSPLEPAVD
jgi:hypothetical protein